MQQSLPTSITTKIRTCASLLHSIQTSLKNLQIGEGEPVLFPYFQNENGSHINVCLPQLKANLFLNNVENNKIPVDFAVTEFDLLAGRTLPIMHYNLRNHPRRYESKEQKI